MSAIHVPLGLMIPMLFMAAIVVLRVVCLAAHLDRKTFTGGLLRFTGMTLGYAFIAGGAGATAVGLMWGPPLLLAGVALMVLCERRIMPR